MVQKGILAAALVAASCGAAVAAPITVTMTASDIYGDNLDKLGLMAGDTITSVATYDPDAPTVGPSRIDTTDYTYDQQYHHNARTLWSIGGVSYTTGAIPSFVYVRDGVRDGARNINDFFQNYFRNMLNGVNGISHSFGYIRAVEGNETSWSGFAPTAAQLNDARTHLLYINFSGDDANTQFFSGNVRSSTVTFSIQEAAVVPLPASGALLLTAFGTVFALRRRRKTA